MDIAICDYGIGNLRSAEKAFQHIGLDAHLTSDPAMLDKAKKIVLPGVGAFGECVVNLQAKGFVEPLLRNVKAGKPLMGICVGMQMLFEASEESPEINGLGLLKGRVVRFKGAAYGQGALKVPQIGWNALTFKAPRHAMFKDLDEGSHVYFVHSFYAQPEDAAVALAWSEYGAKFCCAAGRGNVMGVQFHPEKSQRVGLKIIENFGKL
jgi:imidazole glycerol-phosphate synthase subunit HisH